MQQYFGERTPLCTTQLFDASALADASFFYALMNCVGIVWCTGTSRLCEPHQNREHFYIVV